MAKKHILTFLSFLFIINCASTLDALWRPYGYYGWRRPYYYGPYYDPYYYSPSGGEVAAGAITGLFGTAIAASERRKDREAYLEGRRRDREENRRLREENRRLKQRRRSYTDYDDDRPRKYRRTMHTQTESTEPETSETD